MSTSSSYLEQIQTRYHLDEQALQQQGFVLLFENDTLKLQQLTEPKLGAVFVDFIGGAVGHRRKFGGGKGQSIAKAVGLKAGRLPSVLDATAGLGRDAFVLAGLGCHVTLCERSGVVAALLEDGLRRAAEDPEIGSWIHERMQLIWNSSISAIRSVAVKPDVIYLDPMFPHKKGKALVKKEMRLFQSLVGADVDADQLLAPALEVAGSRVVVKRPGYAPPLAGVEPTMAIETKKNRFDVYVIKAISG